SAPRSSSEATARRGGGSRSARTANGSAEPCAFQRVASWFFGGHPDRASPVPRGRVYSARSSEPSRPRQWIVEEGENVDAHCACVRPVDGGRRPAAGTCNFRGGDGNS